MRIPYINLKKQYSIERKKLIQVIDKVLQSGNYVTAHDEVEKFEKKISKICNTKYCLALNSGTDALTLALYSVGVRSGDEVITVPNSFIATTSVIIHLGAKPIFVDVKKNQNINEKLIENKITKKTKAILPVHLTGRMCDMATIIKISKKYKIPVIEDCAQSILSKYNDKISGSWGDVGCFSAHPLKNLNAMGDSGYLVTNNKKIYENIKDLRNHGMTNRNLIKNFGYVSRMDNIQAGILNFRLKSLNKIIYKRRNNFNTYSKHLDQKHIYFPKEERNEFNTYHTFVIQVKRRDELKNFLQKKGIGTSIHYPIPIHKQPAYNKIYKNKEKFVETERQAMEILTLPINQFLKKKEITFISNKVNEFFKKK